MAKADEIDKLLQDLNKFTPDGANRPIAMRGSNVEKVRSIPCFSPSLAYLLAIAGWPEGKLIEIFGKEHAGKTSFALLALKDCFDYYKGEKLVAYIDLEHRFNPEWAETLGLPVDNNLIVIQPPDAESGTDMMVELIKSKRICAIVWDSVGGAATRHSMQALTDKNDRMGGAASVMKRNVQTVAPLANLYNVTCFYLNQLRADMDGYNRAMTPGGHAVKHAMSVRLYLRPGSDKYFDKINGENTQVGFPIVMKTVKNSYGPPLREGWTDFYSQPSIWLDHAGIDVERDLTRMGILVGAVTKAGSWYSYEDIKEQGRESFFQTLYASGKKEEFFNKVVELIKNKSNSADLIVIEDEEYARPETNPDEDINDSEV
jgi:recombination protein RecA